jgi:two-component system chemotaxis response regulator CheY
MGRGGGTFSTSKNFGLEGQKKIRIVVADDNHEMVETLATLLEQKGMKVVGKAYDGEEASQLYFLHKPDVILLDLNMPNYDGHYAIEKIMQKDPNAKIIVISAYLDKTFQSNKVSSIFSKPYDIDEITEEIKQITKS